MISFSPPRTLACRRVTETRIHVSEAWIHFFVFLLFFVFFKLGLKGEREKAALWSRLRSFNSIG